MKNKGSAIYFSLVVLVIIQGIILGLSSILISQIRMVRGMEHSVVAFYAADSGIEEALNIIRTRPANQCFAHNASSSVSLNGATSTYQIIIKDGTAAQSPCIPHLNCNEDYYCIKSEGDYKGIKRAIEVGN